MTQQQQAEQQFQAALTYARAGDRLKTINSLRGILDQNPDIGDLWGRIATLAERAGDAVTAARAQEKYVLAKPADDNRQHVYARMLNAAGRLDEGLRIARQLADKYPSSGPAAFRAANLAFFRGDTEYARETFVKSLEYNPNEVECWNQLVKLNSYELGDPAYEAMTKLRDNFQAANEHKKFLNACIALGDAYDQIGEYDRAFENYLAGNTAMGAQRTYNVTEERNYVERMLNYFSTPLFEQLHENQGGHPSDRPIFIIGMPRSGTTLLEQLLTTHKAVCGGGESDAFPIASLPLGKLHPRELGEFEKMPGNNGLAPFKYTGKMYLRFMTELFGAEGRLIDKSLELPMLVGHALAAFPNASFIWIRRDPRDVAMSVFKTRFLARHDWSWSWQGIAERMVQVERIQRHICKLFPERMLFIPYESLVEEPADWTRKLLEHCKLSGDNLHEKFHQADRAVKTASKLQVRQPISNKSVGSWRRYESHMTPFIEAYERLRQEINANGDQE